MAAMTGDGHPVRVEQCCECNTYVSDWVEAEHRNGRICRPCESLATLRAANDALTRERDEALESKAHTQQWYASRLEPLEDWARKELTRALREQFFSIIANACSSVSEKPPTLTVQLNLMRHDRDQLRSTLAERDKELAEVRATSPEEYYAIATPLHTKREDINRQHIAVKVEVARTLRADLSTANARIAELEKAVTEANWLLSSRVDAGGGAKELLKWAQIQCDYQDKIQPVIKSLMDRVPHDPFKDNVFGLFESTLAERDQLKARVLELEKDKERLSRLEADKYLIAIKATVGGWVFERTATTNTHVNNGNAGLRNAIDLAYPDSARAALADQARGEGK